MGLQKATGHHIVVRIVYALCAYKRFHLFFVTNPCLSQKLSITEKMLWYNFARNPDFQLDFDYLKRLSQCHYGLFFQGSQIAKYAS